MKTSFFNCVVNSEEYSQLRSQSPSDIEAYIAFLKQVVDFAVETDLIPLKNKMGNKERIAFRYDKEKILLLRKKAKSLGYNASEFYLEALRLYVGEFDSEKSKYLERTLNRTT